MGKVRIPSCPSWRQAFEALRPSHHPSAGWHSTVENGLQGKDVSDSRRRHGSEKSSEVTFFVLDVDVCSRLDELCEQLHILIGTEFERAHHVVEHCLALSILDVGIDTSDVFEFSGSGLSTHEGPYGRSAGADAHSR